jgi:hypothetical protein
VALISFWLITRGAGKLARLIKKPAPQSAKALVTVTVFMLAGLYAFLALAKATHDGTGGPANYHLPGWLVLLTIILPYLFVWHRGSIAAFEIQWYRKHTKGLLYKRSLKLLAAGVASVIVTQIVFQFFVAVADTVGGLRLGSLLLVIYALLGVMAAGYVMIAMGAKKLQKIEEV